MDSKDGHLQKHLQIHLCKYSPKTRTVKVKTVQADARAHVQTLQARRSDGDFRQIRTAGEVQ